MLGEGAQAGGREWVGGANEDNQLRAVIGKASRGAALAYWASPQAGAKNPVLTAWLHRHQRAQVRLRAVWWMGWWSWRTSVPCVMIQHWTTTRWALPTFSDFPSIQALRTDLSPRVSKLPGLEIPAPWECHTPGALLSLSTPHCPSFFLSLALEPCSRALGLWGTVM